MVTAASIYLSLMGDKGLRSVAVQCHEGLQTLLAKALALPQVSQRFTGPAFHEAVLELPVKAADLLSVMLQDGIIGGYDLGEVDATLDHCMLVNVTETKTVEDIEVWARSLAAALEDQSC